jgi:hypothetical protein
MFIMDLKERDLLGHCIEMKIILEWVLEKKGCEGMDWLQLTQDRVQWLAFINIVMNLPIS